MAIKVTCQSCGKNLQVADSMAGKKGKCPQCKSVLIVPAQEEQAAPVPKKPPAAPKPAAAPKPPAAPKAEPESADVSECPNCGKEMAEGDVFCTDCGTNIQTGEKIDGV